MQRWMVLFAAMVAPPAHAQSIDTILAAAARSEASTTCRETEEDGTILVCGRRDRSDRYRLPLPTQRAPGEIGAVAGEVPPPRVDSPYLGGCGMFAGQRRCSRRESEAYGYGRGRDPVTLVGRLIAKAVDGDAEVGPVPDAPPRGRE